MGEHLKGKLQGMIRQRFENYLHISKRRPELLTVELSTLLQQQSTTSSSALGLRHISQFPAPFQVFKLGAVFFFCVRVQGLWVARGGPFFLAVQECQNKLV